VGAQQARVLRTIVQLVSIGGFAARAHSRTLVRTPQRETKVSLPQHLATLGSLPAKLRLDNASERNQWFPSETCRSTSLRSASYR
jgi:hypothetical protein